MPARPVRLLLPLALAVPLLGGALASTPAQAARRAASAPEVPPARRPGMVFIANTGLEDIGTLSSSLRHARAALESGHLGGVTWIVYGRAIVALDPTVKAVPPAVLDELAAAQAAGVRVVACGVALERYGIDPAGLDPRIEVVPNGLAEVARLVAAGDALLKY